MKFSFMLAAVCAAALVFGSSKAEDSPRHIDPLTISGSTCIYSQSTGRMTLNVSMIIPRADPLTGSTVGIEVGGATVSFQLNSRGLAQSADGKVSVRLGKPTCGCPDGSHSAIMTVAVNGTTAKKSALLPSGGAIPATATIYFSSGSDSINYEAALNVKK